MKGLLGNIPVTLDYSPATDLGVNMLLGWKGSSLLGLPEKIPLDLPQKVSSQVTFHDRCRGRRLHSDLVSYRQRIQVMHHTGVSDCT